MKRISKIVGVLVALAALVVAGYWYLQHKKFYPSTDDAYVQAHVVNIAAQVSGQVKAIFVQNLTHVKKGQRLFKINPQPFQLAVNKAKDNLQNIKQQVLAAEDAVTAAKAMVVEREAQLYVTRRNAKRILILVDKKLFSIAKGDEARSNLKIAEAALVAAKNQLKEAQQKLGKPGAANAQIRAATVALEQTKLDLSYTSVEAPADGYLVNFKLRTGDVVTAQQPLFALIEGREWWVNANFKETDLERIRPHQVVTIKVDMYPNATFKGIVEKIDRGSGASFSLLPPEQASGNWVKVTQRFMVKVKIIDPNPDYPLRIGSSCSVTVNTRPK